MKYSTSLLYVIFVVACIFLPIAEAAPPEPTKILLIGKQPDHPWGTHMYMHTCEVLAKCLRLTEGVETVLADRWPKSKDNLYNVKTMVVYSSSAAEMLLDSPHRDELDRLMKQGVGLVTIHWASSVKEKNFERLGPRWMGYLGGTWISNVGISINTSLLKQLDPSHPICRGWSSYELHDEYYLNPVIGENSQPLLQVHAKDQDVVVGWTFERGDGGRAYGTTILKFIGASFDISRTIRFRKVRWSRLTNSICSTPVATNSTDWIPMPS